MKQRSIIGFILGAILLLAGIYLLIPQPSIESLKDDAGSQTFYKVSYNAPFTIRFSQPMDTKSVEADFFISPKISGTFNWPDSKTLEYFPKMPLSIGDNYRIQIGKTAKSIYFKQLPDPILFYFEVTGPPFVKFVSPVQTDDSVPIIQTDDVLTVLFDRPLDVDSIDPDDLIAIEPRVDGTIKWLRNDVFEFSAKKWPISTSFKAIIGKGLPATSGGETEENFVFSFKTPSLGILDISPSPEAVNVGLLEPITITFNQAVDLDSVKPGRNVQIFPSNDVDATDEMRTDGFFNTDVTYGVDENGNVNKNILVFTPTFPYLAGKEHRFVLTSGLRPIVGNLEFDGSIEVPFTTAENDAGTKTPSQITVTAKGNPSLWLLGKDPIYQLKSLGQSVLNFELCPVSRKEFIRQSEAFAWSEYRCKRPLRFSKQINADPSETVRMDINLKEKFDLAFSSGLYFFSVFGDGSDSARFSQLFQISDTGLTLKKSDTDMLIWATDIVTGQPVSRMDVFIYSGSGEQLMRGTTDGEGVYKITKELPNNIYVVAQKTFDGEDRWAMTSSLNPISNPLKFVGSWISPNEPRLFLYADNSVFKFGDTLNYKGIYRLDNDARLKLPRANKLTVGIRTLDGITLYEESVALNRDGSFNGSIPVDASMPAQDLELFSYTLYDGLPVTTTYPIYVSSEASDIFVRTSVVQSPLYTDDVASAVVEVTGELGRPIPGVQIDYKVYKEPYKPALYNDFPEFHFGGWGNGIKASELVKEGQLTLDQKGKARLRFADGSDELENLKYTLVFSVRDSSGHTIPHFDQYTVTQSNKHVGLFARKRFIGPFDPIRVRTLVIDSLGEPLDGESVELDLYSVSNGKKLIEKKQLVSGTDSNEFEWRTKKPLSRGEYRLIANVSDSEGHEAISQLPIFVIDESSESKPTSARSALRLVADQTEYFVGGKARLALISPAGTKDSPASALITYERGQIIDYQIIQVDSDIEVIEIPVTESMMPNFFVTATVSGASELTESTSAFIKISTRENAIDVSMEGQIKDEEAVINIHTTDYQNRPVPSVVSLGVTDSKALANINPLDFFFANRALQVQTFSSVKTRSSSYTKDLSQGAMLPPLVNLPSTFFNQISYFNPLIQTDDGGYAQIRIPLAEGSDSFLVRAVASRGKDRFGAGDLLMTPTVPVSIRLISPSAVSDGDKFEIRSILTNESPDQIEMDIELTADPLLVQSFANRRVSLAPFETKTILFELMAQDVGDFNDIPIKLVSDFASAEFDLKVRSTDDENDIEPFTTSSAFNALIARSYPTSENRISILLSYLALTDGELSDAWVNSQLGLLLEMQNKNGGFSFVPSSLSSPYLTAYALYALNKAKFLGFAVDDNAYSNVIDYLWRTVNLKDELPIGERMFMLFALSEAGQYDTRATLKLFEKRKEAPIYAQAALLMNLDNLADAGQRSARSFADRLRSDLLSIQVKSGSEAHFEEPSAGGIDMRTDQKATAMVLLALGPDNPASESIKNYLIRQPLRPSMLNPHDTAWTILAYEAMNIDDSEEISLDDGFKFLVSNPFFIRNDFFVFNKPSLAIPVKQMRANQQYRGKLKFILPEDAYHVAVEVPLAAGLVAGELTSQNNSKLSEFAHVSISDSQILLLAEYLPKGVYEYEYLVFAATPGTYNQNPASIRLIYQPDKASRTEAGVIDIRQ